MRQLIIHGRAVVHLLELESKLGGQLDDASLGRPDERAADVDVVAGRVTGDGPRASADAVPRLQYHHVDAVLPQQPCRRQTADAAADHHHRRLRRRRRRRRIHLSCHARPPRSLVLRRNASNKK